VINIDQFRGLVRVATVLFKMSRKLSLFSFNIPKDVLSALMRKGYENVQDLSSTNPDALAKGVVLHRCVPFIIFNSIQILISLCNKRKTLLTVVKARTFQRAQFL
jgi:hypothetical protein